MTPPRVAFLPDTFHEVNGVAHTSRHLEAFARRHQKPFLSVHAGVSTESSTDGSVRTVQLRRSPFKIGLDANLDYDLALMRYVRLVCDELVTFGAELIHITGPGDFGTLGWYLARKLHLPLVISWHTSLHEYAGRRIERSLRFLGREASSRIGSSVEKLALQVLQFFYQRAAVILAPNEDIVSQIRTFTRSPVFLMSRGVDTALFSPRRRSRTDSTFRLGYVGRLTPEKNVRFLAELARALSTLGRTGFEFVIVGEGSEENWLRAHLPNATFTGVLRGERLAAAYASFDLFVFPSHTDTFGNVVLEALASGVPAVVTDSGGPRFLIETGITGYVAPSDREFISAVNAAMTNSELHRRMRRAARARALLQTWDSALEPVFDAYQVCLHRQASVSETSKRDPLLSSRVHGRGCS